MTKKRKNKDIGNIRIKEEVISAIVSSALKEFKEIARVGSSFAGGIKQVLSRKDIHKGIKVEIENNSVKIDISIIAKYGCSIHEVAKNLQYNVKDEVEKMTGLKVKKVNIIVQNLSTDTEEEGK